MPVPTIEAVHIDAAMTAISVGYKNPAFVSERIFPTVGVKKKSDKYFLHTKEQFRDDVDDLRRPGDSAREVRWSLSQDNYSCEGHARTGVLPDEVRANSDPAVQAEIRTTQLATDKVMLRQELLFRDQMEDFTTNFTGANIVTVGAAPAKFYNGAAGADETLDPIEQVADAKVTMLKNAAVMPNVILMNREVAEGIKMNALVRDRFKFTNKDATGTALGPLLTDDALQSMFQMPVVIAEALLNTGEFDAADTLNFILGKHVWLLHVTPTPGLQIVTFGYTFLWTLVAGGQSGTVVERERATGGRKSDLFHVHKFYDQKVVDRLAGFVFKDAIV